MRRFERLIPVAAVLGIGAVCWLIGGQLQRSDKETQNAIPYIVLDDYMGTTIKIGVAPMVTEKELRATLSKAADEHQDDAARDYLMSMFLRVEAYLVKDGEQSSAPAGTLRRYVPPGNPAERKQLTTDRTTGDAFTVSIEEARRS